MRYHRALLPTLKEAPADASSKSHVLLTRAGYTWLTEHVGRTEVIWSWDHLFVRGLALAAPGRVGRLRDVRGASDHHPVWAELELAAPAALSPSAARP